MYIMVSFAYITIGPFWIIYEFQINKKKITLQGFIDIIKIIPPIHKRTNNI